MRQLFKFLDSVREDGMRTAMLRTVGHLRRKLFIAKYSPGIKIAAEDWDNLIILDAYRYDYFKKYSRFEGNLRQEFSRGNRSGEFLRQNFSDEQLHDTVYITANPHATVLDEDTFYTIEFLLDRWDSEVGVVLPDDVTDAAINAEKKYPNKRLIVHYMQPHDPHLGETAKTYRERTDLSTEATHSSFPETRFPRLFTEGEISKEELEKAYVETIRIVEDSVEDLLSELTGKTIISSDHGENLGEERFGQIYLEHSIDTKECRFVPWLELPYEERKDVTEEEPIGYELPDKKRTEKQLSALGYL
jgi:hypothetical protein